MAFLALGNSDHVVSVCIDFPLNSKGDVPFHGIAYGYSRADWDGLCDHLRDVPWEDIFKLGASTAASEFCEWVKVGIDLIISHAKYQVRPHSSPCFSAICAAAIAHRNYFFRLFKQNKSCESKLKLRHANNRCKRVFEAVKLAYANQTKEYRFPKTWLSGLLANFFAYSVLNKGKFVMPLFNSPEVLYSASDKAKFFC